MTSVKKQFLISSVIITSLLTAPAFAVTKNQDSNNTLLSNEQQKQAQTNEEIGFGTGMVIGAIFGGPAGAFITGLAGNFLAKSINAEDEVEQLSIAFEQEKRTNETALLALQSKIEQSEQGYQHELLALEQNYQASSLLQAKNLLMSLQFSTGSSEIKPHYLDQIAALADIVAQAPQLTVDLSGYTDMQGSDELNQALSLARTNAVKNALIDQGVAADRIRLYAYGEQQPVVASTQKEISFYDRRVVIKLNHEATVKFPTNENSTQTAQNY
jgi:sortase system peptidoglycan-associated protein